MTILSSTDTELVPFEFDQSTIVRTTMIEGEPWFIRNDVCKALGIKNPSDAISGFDDDDLATTEGVDSMGRKTKVVMVSEPGLYQLIFQSRKPEARTFKRWVTHDVLPALRKTGTYTVNEQETEPITQETLENTLANLIPLDPEIARQRILQEKIRTLETARGIINETQLQARAWLLLKEANNPPTPEPAPAPAPVPATPTNHCNKPRQIRIGDFLEQNGYITPGGRLNRSIIARYAHELLFAYEYFYRRTPRRKHGNRYYTTEDLPFMHKVATYHFGEKEAPYEY